ncbi:helix-turn-helix transcriptional regulator [Nonomuraea spiralis]|uniref:Helix-turn-helix transcriptional regulator n=1 Tax=Nonomuraea spiralis TaxID=46182 RepID=A0ABV5II47_9ACTN|nr:MULTISPECIES: helix-turn-helix transcriptional regulator [Nonomuraea]RSN09324.1 PadR family transcriptional regulator [Nonomuraea sp. WAC 01424]GGS98180.1 PadR family transcriptional regulator [Nonomuraea spiralis]
MEGGETRGLLSPILLLLIWNRPGHGYDLIDRLADLGVAAVEPGHVYRLLRGLERDQFLVSSWITSRAGPPRRKYEITASGLSDLKASMIRLRHLGRVLDTCVALWEEPRPPDAGPSRSRVVSWQGDSG